MTLVQREINGLLPPRNQEWGFYGETNSLVLWYRVSKHLVDEFNAEPVDVRNFLDSSAGRHLADGMSEHTLRWVFDNWWSWFTDVLDKCKANRETFDRDFCGCGAA
jgi:hypothetical protein